MYFVSLINPKSLKTKDGETLNLYKYGETLIKSKIVGNFLIEDTEILLTVVINVHVLNWLVADTYEASQVKRV